MTWRVHDIDPRAFPFDACRFGQDRNPTLALKVVGIHRPLGHVLAFPERARLLQQLVHKRCLAMVDMGDDRDVTQVH